MYYFEASLSDKTKHFFKKKYLKLLTYAQTAKLFVQIVYNNHLFYTMTIYCFEVSLSGKTKLVFREKHLEFF